MAKTLMVRPYVFAASSRAARNLFLRQAQPTRPFVSAVLFNRARTSCTKLQAHSNSKNSVGEEYSCGNSLGFWFVPVSGRRFSTRATNVNDAGSIDSPLMHSMEKKIKEHLNAESVTVRDAYGDGRHVRPLPRCWSPQKRSERTVVYIQSCIHDRYQASFHS
nr:protein BOLA4, chloroplastic/mitochondrial-like isoform X2 [Quercus suber]